MSTEQPSNIHILSAQLDEALKKDHELRLEAIKVDSELRQRLEEIERRLKRIEQFLVIE